MKLLLATLFLLTALSFNAVAQFKRGYYYKNDGTKITGLLRFNYGGNAFTDKMDGDCSLSFKKDEDAKKITLTTNDIRGFVIEGDSFGIVKNFRLNSFITYPQDFAKVITTGKINLFLYYSIVNSGGQYGGSSTKTDWIIEKNGTFDKLTKKKFKELMPIYLSDSPELLDQIKRKQLGYRDSEEIIKMYNQTFKRAQ